MPLARQIALLAELRWRILRNSLRTKNKRLDLIGLAVLGVFAGLFVLAMCFVFFAAAYSFAATQRLGWLDLLFWGVCLWWQLMPIFAAGFGVSFEFGTLLRFPVRFSAFYLMGLAYGLTDFAAVAGSCWFAAMIAGVAAGRPRLLPAMLLVCVLLVLVNITLERLIGSWLERLLAKRRSREIFFALFILLIVSVQFIPMLGRYGSAASPWVFRALPYIDLLPPPLATEAMRSAIADEWGSFLASAMGIFAYVAVLASLLWLRFAAQYRGEQLSDSPAPLVAASKSTGVHSNRDTLKFLSPPVAAVVRKEFRYLFRNGFAALLLFLPPVLVFALVTRARLAHSNSIPPETFFPGLMGYLILILMAPSYNSFAYESRGIQTYFTAPVRFRDILLGKNFVQVCLVAGELALCIAAFSYRVGLPSTPIFFATLAAIVFTVVGQLSIANWSSLSFPRKLAFGQIRGQRQSGMAALMAFAGQILVFSIAGLVLTLGKWTGDRWLPAEVFAGLSLAAAGGYFASLDALSNLAEKKKERLMEALCR
jgi:ABC-2 type transport system permease protein